MKNKFIFLMFFSMLSFCKANAALFANVATAVVGNVSGVSHGTNPVTMCIKFKTSSSDGNLIDFGDNTAGNRLSIEVGGNLLIITDDSTTSFTGGPVVSDGNPHSAVYTWDSSTGTMYLDGVSIFTTTHRFSQISTGIYIASFLSNPNRPITATIEDARIYNRALSINEVKAYHSSVFPNTDLLKMWLKFDDYPLNKQLGLGTVFNSSANEVPLAPLSISGASSNGVGASNMFTYP